MHRPPEEKKRISVPEICLTLIVGAALLGGIYGVYKLAMRDKNVDAAVSQIDEMRQMDMTSTDGALKNPWGGNITSTHEKQGLKVTLDGIPASACSELLGHYAGENTDFITLMIDDKEFGEGRDLLTSESINSACADPAKHQISWQFN